MVSVDARCTQCGHTDHGSPGENTNYVTYDVPRETLQYGGSRMHGTEELACPQCSGTCSREDCEYGDPCHVCEVETIHNRCGSSVNRGN